MQKRLDIGRYNRLTVKERGEKVYILDSPIGEIPLRCDTRGARIKTGEELEVFIYTDSKHKPVATLSTPYAVLGEFACMTVVDTNAFGAYLDWGIEKDLFVYQKEQKRPMKKGKRYVVHIVRHDKTGSIQGTSFLENHFSSDTKDLREGEAVSLLIYAITEIGIMAVVNNRFSGMLYVNEVFEKLQIGDVREGFIKKIRRDGKIDLTLKPQVEMAIDKDKTILMKRLHKAGGFLPLHDGSDPDQIRDELNMSKKSFKKAVGGLYREQKITLAEDGIRLRKKL